MSAKRRIGIVAAALTLVGGLLLAPAAEASTSSTSAQTAAGQLATGSGVTSAGPRVKTADLSQFQPGNIISDAKFFDRHTMSEAQIQQFLEAKMPRCAAGYTCLKDYYDTSRATAADPMCAAYPGGMRERASTIIYKVAQACGINPQVILVMLQKEQGLVLRSAPTADHYRAAMGQACPDTGPCDARYYGLFNQVYGGAWQLKRYGNPPGTSQYFTWYAPGRTWNIQWHPNASCGSAPVHIQNQATANLYYYTPYQPNAASLRAGYSPSSDPCASYGNRNFYQFFTDWFGPPVQAARSPFGNLEIVSAEPGYFRVAGWAIDPDTTSPIEVHIYVRGVGFPIVANANRPDVGAANPDSGSLHGFDVKVPAQGGGQVDVCVHAINVAVGMNSLFGCRVMDSMSGSPVGAVDSFKIVPGGVQLSGWALDPDTTASIEVHAYFDSVGIPLKAAASRPDLVPHYPAYGAAHGFSATVPAVPGAHNFCLYAINTGAGSTTTLRCERVMIPGPPDVGQTPIGVFDALTVNGTSATAQGWTLDGDTTAPIKIHIYVNGVGREYTADKTRNDIAAAFPAFGATHGFSEAVQLAPGKTDVCVWGINTSGNHLFLGCKSVVLPEPRNPIGNYELLTPGSGGATVAGWALDPDTTDPIKMHVYVDGVRTELVADKSRPDVAAAYAGLGDRHGFEQFLPMSAGKHQVCVWALDSAGGVNIIFGCRDVTVS